MLKYDCAKCKRVFRTPHVRRWYELIDGENWCAMSEEVCPFCGEPEIMAIEIDEDRKEDDE